MRDKKMKIALAFILALGLVTAPSVSTAVVCKPAKPSGKTVGKIQVSGISMPIKPFIYPEGGVMEPQGSTLMAALSKRHMPLSSTMGSSVIVWHRDYNGCAHELNIFLTKDVGDRFKVTDENGKTTTYEITKTAIVKKGKYDKSWFTLIGPRQLTLVTCTGKFKGGHYEDNFVLIAKPI